MKKISIKYNPYLVSTRILIEGHEPKNNSALRFEKQRLQEWADKLPELLVKECNDKNFKIEFKGTQMDYEDLKLSFDLKKDSISSTIIHDSTLDVSLVEQEVDKIFDTIQKGPIAEFKDPSFAEAFQRAKNKEFEVNVIATMGSGKSTLINALLGRELLPNRQEATTATVVKIINANQKHYSLKAFDANGNSLPEFDLEEATYEQIDALNDNPTVGMMEIRGEIPFVSTVGMQLVLVDTPGPNNERNKNHKKLTYQMLSDSDKSLVLYILNGEQLGVEDNENLLDYVCGCMKERGKQSRDRYLFVVNKLDVWKLKEADRIEKKLQEEFDNLEKKGIFNPCLFPVSSLAALELRTEEKDIQALNTFKTRSEQSNAYHFDSYYNFNRLPMVVRNRLQSILDKGDTNQTIEIHSGIVSIEQAISLYVNKYARTTKIKDLVDSFNNQLNDLATMERLKKDIREDLAKKKEIEEQIKKIRDNLQAAKEAKKCTGIIDSIDLTKGLRELVNSALVDIRSEINNIIMNNNGTSVELSKAKEACAKIDKTFESKVIQLQVKIDRIIQKTYDDTVLMIVEEYKKYLNQLCINTKSMQFTFSPANLVSSDLKGLIDTNKLINNLSTVKDESYYKTVEYTVTVEGNRGSRAAGGGLLGAGIAGLALIGDLCGGMGVFSALAAGAGLGAAGGAISGRGSHEEKRTRQERVEKYVTYVNMSDLVTKYFMPRQEIVSKTPDRVINHVMKETLCLKSTLNKKLAEIDNLIDEKLKELLTSQDASTQKDEDIQKKEAELKWIEGIQEQINKLIFF